MRGKMTQFGKWLAVLACSYLFTFAVLLGLAFLLYLGKLGNSALEVWISCLLFLASLLGGYLLGGRGCTKKYLWGMLFGLLYFCILCLISCFVHRQGDGSILNVISSFLLCLGGGMSGGMLHSLI